MCADCALIISLANHPMFKTWALRRGGLILYRTTVPAAQLKAGATLYIGGKVHDAAHVSAPCHSTPPVAQHLETQLCTVPCLTGAASASLQPLVRWQRHRRVPQELLHAADLGPPRVEGHEAPLSLHFWCAWHYMCLNRQSQCVPI